MSFGLFWRSGSRRQMFLCFRLHRVFVLRQKLGDTEIEQLWFSFCVRKNVVRFDIAMNNHIPMREFNSGADLQKQLQSFTRRQPLRDCKSRDRCADDVVHNEVGEAIFSCACIEQSRDVWVIEPRQDLTFCSKSAQDFSRVGSSIQYLDRDLFLKLTIRPLRQKNCAHPSVAKFTNDGIRAHALSASRRSFLPERGRCVLDTIFEAVSMLLKKCLRFGQERLSLFEQIRILTAASLDYGNPGR